MKQGGTVVKSIAETEALEHRRGAVAPLAPRGAVHEQGERDVPERGVMGDQVEGLEDHPDAAGAVGGQLAPGELAE